MNDLEQFINRVLEVADKRNLSVDNPITLLIDVSDEQYYVIVGHTEPNHVTVPLNVTWIVSDPESPFYKKALRRASALPFNGMRNTWAELRTYQDFVEEAQFWDFTATFQPGEVQVTGVKEASTSNRGLFQLNREPAVDAAGNPIVVGSNDPRMSNSRQPIPHTHPLLPSTMVGGSTGINEFFVHLIESESPQTGQILFLTEENDDGSWNGFWRFPVEEDIVYDGPTVTQLLIRGPENDQVDEGTPVPFTVDAEFSDGSVRRSVSAQWEIISNGNLGSISTSTGVFTSNDIDGDQTVRIRATWRHAESRETHRATYDLLIIDKTVVAVLDRIELDGPASLDEGGNTGAYTLTAFYDDGSSRGVTPTTFTSSNAGAGNLNAETGVFTSGVDVINNQTTTLAATYTENGVTRSDSLDITVIDTTVYPQSAEIRGPATVDENDQATYELFVTFTDQTASVVAVSDWTLDNENAGTLDPSSGLFVAPTNLDADEVAQISASFTQNGRTVTRNRNITVVDTSVYPISGEIRGPQQIDEGEVATYQYFVTFSDDTVNAVNVTDWASTNEVAGTIGADTGEFVAATDVSDNANTEISASFTQSGQTVSTVRSITVVDTTDYVVGLTIIGNSRMSEGSQQNLELEATYQSGAKEIVPAKSWSSNNTGVLTVSSSGEVQAVPGLRNNVNVEVTATYDENGISESAVLEINVVDETVYPVQARIQGPEVVDENATVGYSLLVTFDDGTERTESVNTFSVDDVDAGTITSTGQFTAIANVAQNTVIPAVISASFTVDGTTVNASLEIEVVDTTVYPESAAILGPVSVDEESTYQYQLEVTFSDASTRTVQVTDWSSTNTAASIVPATGVLTTTSIAADTTSTLSASFTQNGQTVSDTMDITIKDTTVYPVGGKILGRSRVPENQSEQYQLEVEFSDGSKEVRDARIWATSNTTAGSINTTTGEFQARRNVLQDTGTEISAEFRSNGRTINATLTITITDETAYPTSAHINGPDTVDENEQATFTLRVVFDDNSERDVNVDSWTSSNPTAGIIDGETGLFEAGSNTTRENITTEINASFTLDEVTVTDTKTIGVVDTTVYAGTGEIRGPGTVDEGGTATYTFHVMYSNGTEEQVVPTWSLESGESFAFIDSSTGVLQVSEQLIGDDKRVVIAASYSEGPENIGTTFTVSINDALLRPVDMELRDVTDIWESQTLKFVPLVTYDNGSSGTDQETVLSVEPESAGTIANAVFTPNAVDVDTEVTINATLTKHGKSVTTSASFVLRDVFPNSMNVTGPNTVQEEQTGQYGLNVTWSDSSVTQPQAESWSITTGSEFATIDATGLLTAGTIERSDELNPDGTPVRAQEDVVVQATFVDRSYSLQETLNVIVQDTPPVAKKNPLWGHGPQIGPEFELLEGSTVQDFIDNLENELPTENEPASIDINRPDGETYGYFVCRKSLGYPTFTLGQFSGGWDGATWPVDSYWSENSGPIEVTYDDGTGPDTWLLYRTDYAGPDDTPSTFDITFPE